MSQKKTPVILTIDDEKGIRESIRYFLEDYEYQVLEAENGKIGIEIFKRENPDLILVDLRMPEMDGLEVLRIVRNQSPDTPVIVISGTGVIGDAVEALHLGAWDYLLKPIGDLSVLLHSVEKALERSRLILENHAYQQYLEQEVAKRTRELEKANKELLREIALRKKTEASLRENEKKYRGYIENAPYGVFVADALGKYIEVNNAACQITGYSIDELSHMNIPDLIHKDFKEQGRKHFQEVMDKGRAVGELRFLRKDGSEMEMLVEAVKISDNRFIAFCKDLEEKKQAEAAKMLLESQLRQAQKMESIGTLAGGIAHDFNNILSSVIGYTELTIDDLPVGSVARRNLSSVLKAGERAKSLVSQILTFSRQSEQVHIPVQIHIIVKEALKLIRSSLPATIEIHQRITDSGYVMADPTQIHQVVMNLCTNAFHAMQDTGGVLTATLSQKQVNKINSAQYPELAWDNYVVLCIKDTGCGMKQDLLERIFDPYFTTKEKGKGTGLGLAVVHGIIKAHRGTIKVKTYPGKGSSFCVWLPTITVVQNEKADAEPQQLIGREHILIVDDEIDIIQMEQQMLERLGYKVTAFTDSLKALEAFSAAPLDFDVIVTDMTMPGITGYLLAKEMIRIRSNIPIILCTGFSEQIDEKKAEAAGIKKYIIKPAARNDLAKALREVLETQL
ncbi:Two component system response regulator/histidine kinase [Desulfonema limicola]|uniref:histidine kinase n=1 Tax=Desulfonema limicola TaxID=45656 RepID=A0A975B3X8_9BACT|nr:response regulator [Desulfonema limicola]QTA78331.1 Two component system response regulator/histidine kinase [Desulfonema limicola]